MPNVQVRHWWEAIMLVVCLNIITTVGYNLTGPSKHISVNRVMGNQTIIEPNLQT